MSMEYLLFVGWLCSTSLDAVLSVLGNRLASSQLVATWPCSAFSETTFRPVEMASQGGAWSACHMTSPKVPCKL